MNDITILGVKNLQNCPKLARIVISMRPNPRSLKIAISQLHPTGSLRLRRKNIAHQAECCVWFWM